MSAVKPYSGVSMTATVIMNAVTAWRKLFLISQETQLCTMNTAAAGYLYQNLYLFDFFFFAKYLLESRCTEMYRENKRPHYGRETNHLRKMFPFQKCHGFLLPEKG